MDRIISRVSAMVSGLSLLLINASGVLAQYDYDYDYSDTYYDEGAAAIGAGIVGASWLAICCGWLLGLLMLVFNIWMLVHIIQNAPEDKKILWVLLVIFIPFASVFYFFTKKKEWSKKTA